jgi:hypothetical protein
MFSASTLLKIWIAPKDTYTYYNFKNWHERTKRRWRTADVLGVDEVKVLENNRKHDTGYTRPLKIMGWHQESNVFANGKQYEKKESNYADVVGNIYYDYNEKFNSYVLGWWGVGGKFDRTAKTAKKMRNTISIPNSPMLNVSMGFDSRSVMEKIYMGGMTYEDAVTSTFKGKALNTELIYGLTDFNISEGMERDDAYHEALRIVEIVYRNSALANNPPDVNEYNFITNYYNKFIDTNRREMMQIQTNFFFLKEVLSHHPNLGLYVPGPFNTIYRIQGIVGKRDQNIIIQMHSSKNSKKVNYEYVYSVSRDTLVSVPNKGYVPALDLSRDEKILSLTDGSKKIKVEHRYRTEMFYSLVLEGNTVNGYYPWVDAHHICWLNPDYSRLKNMEGLEIIC